MICPNCVRVADRAPLAGNDMPPYRSYRCSCGLAFTTIEVELTEYRTLVLRATIQKAKEHKDGA